MTFPNDDDLISRLVELREFPEPPTALTDRIMADIHLQPVTFAKSHSRWTAKLRRHVWDKGRLYAMGAIAATLALVLGWNLDFMSDNTSPAPGTGLTRFTIYAPDAKAVSIAGSFNSWQPAATPLQPADGSGTWIVELPLSSGRHTYMFVIDGTKWVSDPNAPLDAVSEFGKSNSVVTVAHTEVM